MKKYKSLISMCALAALTHCAKSEIVSAQEQLGNGRIVVNDPKAAIGDVKTPWMIVSPDGKKGFANDFTTNAISVVSEDGVNYYAHQQDDRTKVIHFTVDENGIPSKKGKEIDTKESDEENNTDNMKKRKLVGVKDGWLYFYPTDQYGVSLIYNPTNGAVLSEISPNYLTHEEEPEQQKCLATYKDDSILYLLCNIRCEDQQGNSETDTRLKIVGEIAQPIGFDVFWPALSEDQVMTSVKDHYLGVQYMGDSEGYISRKSTAIAKLPGAISGLSNNGNEVFATTKATNAFYNVTLGQYNVVEGENGNPKPMVPKTQDGLIKVIDNRRNGGKFLYVTSKGIHSIDD